MNERQDVFRRYSETRFKRYSVSRFAVACFQAALILIFNLAPFAHANPSGEQVVAGSAGFDRSGSTLTINTSDQVIINWQNFSIDAGELTKFIQPSATSAALNRVVSGNPSAIYGTLQANGQIFLINPNGILVGSGAVIDTGGFIASTFDVSNSEFLKGGNLNFAGNSAAKIENQGKINAIGGDIILIARQVENKGELNAPDGTVGLAAGTEVLLAQSGDEKIFIKPALSDEPASGTGVLNSGTIQAARAELKAHGNLYALAINNTGIVRANGAVTKNGHVYLTANGGNITSSGTISARNADGSGGTVVVDGGHNDQQASTVLVSGTVETAGTTGGQIHILGDHVGLIDQALVDASGDNGGGTILIGGDVQGSGSVPNAAKTFVGSDATITADALASGNGGKVIVWADDWTRYYGSISARGGALGGNGGFVEVSGKLSLDFHGIANVGAPAGDAGTILLDPRDGTIQAGAAGTGNAFLPEVTFAEGGSGSDYTFGETALEALTGNIVIQVSRNLSINNNVVLNLNNQTSGERVAFQAAGNINFGTGSQIITQGADIWLEADSPHASGGADGSGTVSLGNNALVSSNGGQITLIGVDFAFNGNASVNSGTSAVGINIALSQAAGTLGLGSGGGNQLNNTEIGTLTAGSGTITFGRATTAGSDGLGTGALTITNGAMNIAVGQDITIGAANAAGVVFFASGNIAISNNQSLTTGDPTTITADADGNNSGSFTSSGNAGVTVSSGALTVTAADIGLSTTGVITANGGITFQPSTTARTIALNDATGAFSLSSAELATLSSTGTVTIGAAAGTGAINIGSIAAISLSSETFNLTLRGGATSFNGNGITLASGKTFTFNTGAISSTSTAADVTIAGAGNVVINSSGNVDIDTTVAKVTATSVAGNLILDNTGALDLGAANITGTSAITSTGAITDSGTLAISGATSFVTLNNGGVGITLDDPSSTFGALTARTRNAANSATVGGGISIFENANMSIDLAETTGTVTLTSTGQILDANGAANNVTASSASFSAATGIDLDTTIATLTSANMTGTGAIDINDLAGGLVVTSATTADGSITLNATGGNLTATTVTAGGTGRNVNLSTTTSGNVLLGSVTASGDTVTLTSAGNITDNNGSANNVTAANLAMTAVSGIGSGNALEAAISQLAFNNSTSGNVEISNSGALTIDSIGALTTSANGGGQTIISASSPLTFAVNTTSAGALSAAAGESAAAGDDLTVNAGVTVRSTGGDVLLTAGDNVVLLSGSLAKSDTGDVTLSAGFGDTDAAGNIQLAGSISAANNAFLQAVAGGVSQTAGSITANGLQITGGAGLYNIQQSGNDIATLAASVGGAFTYRDANSFVVGTVGGVSGVQTTSSTLSLLAPSSITINNTPVAGADVQGPIAVDLVSNNLIINGTVSSGTTATLRQWTPGQLINLGGADGVGTLGLTAAEINRVTAGVLRIGDINSGNITITAAIAPTGTSRLTLRTGGAVIDGNAAGADITVTHLAILSRTGIGSANPLDTAVSNLAFNNSTSSNVQIANTGALTIQSLDGITTSSNNGGATTITAASPITFAVNTTSVGTLTATAGELAGTGDDLTVNAGVTVRSTGGDVLLTAGDNVLVVAAGVVQSDTGHVTLIAGNNLENDGTVQAAGDITLVADNDFPTAPGSGTGTLINNGALVRGGRLLVFAVQPSQVLNPSSLVPPGQWVWSTYFGDPIPPLGDILAFKIANPNPSPGGGGSGLQGAFLLSSFTDETDRFYRPPQTLPNDGTHGIYYNNNGLEAAPPNLGSDNGLEPAPPHGVTGTASKKKRSLATDSSFEAFASETPPSL